MAFNFKLSRGCKYAIVALLPVFLLAELVDRDLPETMALWWHLTHGFRARCCGVEVRVPLGYSGEESPNSLDLMNLPGYFRWRLARSPGAMVLLSESPSGPRDEAQVQRAKERYVAACRRQGYVLVRTHTTQVAGKPLECWELYTDHFDVVGPQYEVMCIGRGNNLNALFNGSPTLLTEFYSILETAKPVAQ